MEIEWDDEASTYKDNISRFATNRKKDLNGHTTCERMCEKCREEGYLIMAEEEGYQKTLYDLAIIAEHEKANGNLVCPRCGKEYHMLEMDPDSEMADSDHGPYECWQTHLEMGFCEATPSENPKEADPKE